MKELKFDHLRMWASSCDGTYSLELAISSGFAGFFVTIPLAQIDFEVLEIDEERAALLQAALHDPFQLQATALVAIEQRRYLDVILHSSRSEVEDFLTDKDHGRANGAISNMVHITSGKEWSEMRRGKWFKASVPHPHTKSTR